MDKETKDYLDFIKDLQVKGLICNQNLINYQRIINNVFGTLHLFNH